MANFKKHLVTGAIIGTITAVVLYLIWYFTQLRRNPKYKFNFWQFIQGILAGCALGAITGIVADKIEPATNPNHRGFFHSIAFWFLLSVTAYKTLMERNIDCLCKNLVVIGFAGYSSHLMLDFQTPKSLPILGVKTIMIN
jgi:membrane-bound metal-dependent hydrolase YbcI (DUF457 family)